MKKRARAKHFGYLLFLVGFLGIFCDWIGAPEKSAFFFLGHWWDVVWEIYVPLWLLGGSILLWCGCSAWWRCKVKARTNSSKD